MKEQMNRDTPFHPSSFRLHPSLSWGVRQARLKPLDFQSRDAWVRIPHALPNLGRMLNVTTSCQCDRHARFLVARFSHVGNLLA